MPTEPELSHFDPGKPRHCLMVNAKFAIFFRGRPLKASHTGTSSLRSGWRSRWRSTEALTCRPVSLTASWINPFATVARFLNILLTDPATRKPYRLCDRLTGFVTALAGAAKCQMLTALRAWFSLQTWVVGQGAGAALLQVMSVYYASVRVFDHNTQDP